MRSYWISLFTLSLTLGMSTPCYGLYVMVRSGFGDFEGDDWGSFEKRAGDPTKGNITFTLYHTGQYCAMGAFKYKDHKNLSVALGGRFDVFDIGSLGLEVEILGAYANLGQKNRREQDEWYGFTPPDPDFYVLARRWHNVRFLDQYRLFYLKNQRIAGTQVNVYWEQYILDYLSVGIGGGLGGAYVCTKFTTFEFNDIDGVLVATPVTRRKYVHSGSLLYNFSLFVRAEQFETLFEVGYRHIGLHQMFGAKCYGHTIPKLANLHSDQIYLGVGRTF